MPKRMTNAKLACLDMGLMKSKMKMGVQVVVTDPAQLDAIQKRYLKDTRTVHATWTGVLAFAEAVRYLFLRVLSTRVT